MDVIKKRFNLISRLGATICLIDAGITDCIEVELSPVGRQIYAITVLVPTSCPKLHRQLCNTGKE